MNYDKIKQMISPKIFMFWTNCRSIGKMLKAKELLKYELENINNYSAYITDSRVAEYELLCLRTDSEMDLDFDKIMQANNYGKMYEPLI